MKIISYIKRKLMNDRQYINNLRKMGVSIGEGCEIYRSASFGSEPYLVSIGNHVRVNEKVSFVTHDGGVWVLRELLTIPNKEKIDLFGKITVGSNVHIGTNAMILPGVSIGDNCIIGCNAIVTKDIPSNSVAAGVPARVIETVMEYAEKHLNDFDYSKQLSPEEKRQYLIRKYKQVE